MSAAIEDFLRYLRYERNRSPLTVDAYRRDLLQFEEAAGSVAPEEAVKTDVRKWLSDRARKKDSPRTLRRKTQSLRSFYRWMVLTGRRADNPALELQLAKTDRPLPSFVRDEEMERVLQTPVSEDPVLDRRNHLIILLLYTSGLRQAELLGICDRDIDITRMEIRIHGKGGKERVVPLAEEVAAAIDEWRKIRSVKSQGGRVPLFPGRGGKPLSRSRLYKIVGEALAGTASLRHSPHTLRHTFATSMLNGGADIATVKEFLGHSSLSSTQIYTHLDFSQLRDTYRNAHPRGNRHNNGDGENSDTQKKKE